MTGGKPTLPRCTLARFQPETMDIEEVKRDGWQQHGILVINIDDPRLRWIEQQVLRQLGDRIYPANGGHRGVLR